MSKSPTTLAQEVLKADVGNSKDLRIHEFTIDESAHDDELIQRLYADFSADFERAQMELTKQYGSPSRTGRSDDKLIPLCGVFRFTIWSSGGRQLFLAAAHEDRGCPILLLLGRV